MYFLLYNIGRDFFQQRDIRYKQKKAACAHTAALILSGNYRVEKSSYMYGPYGGLAFRWMSRCLAETSVSAGPVVQHRRYHNVMAGGYTFDFAGQAVEPRTQSCGFAAVRSIRVDSGNHSPKLDAS